MILCVVLEHNWCWKAWMMPESLMLMWMMTSCPIDTDAPRTWAPRSLLQPTAPILVVLQISGASVLFCTRCWSAGIHFTTATPSPSSAWSEMVAMPFRNGLSLNRQNVLSDGCCAVSLHGDRLHQRSCVTLGSTSAVGHRHVLIAIIWKKWIAEMAAAKTSTLYPVLDIAQLVIRLFHKEQTSEAAWMISNLISSYL